MKVAGVFSVFLYHVIVCYVQHASKKHRGRVVIESSRPGSDARNTTQRNY